MIGWRLVQRDNFFRWNAFADYLQLTEEQQRSVIIEKDFPLNVPKRLASKMAKGDLDDPILRQFLPVAEERVAVEGFGIDPVGDQVARQGRRLIHKYAGRVLLTVSSACAMHCRYCFRRHFPYEQGGDFAQEITYIAADPSIHEVILSGGDPLSVSDETLGALIQELEAIPHLKLLRFHTRFPIGIPERITDTLVSLLQGRLQTVFVIHCNHSRELDEEIFAALRKLRCPVLNQSVLLKGVNDSAPVLKELSLALVAGGVIPYYIHHLDKVAGAAHFYVPMERGLAIMKELRESLPGYAVPRYVVEESGKKSKTSITF